MPYERRPIPGYEGLYDADTEGVIFSVKNGRDRPLRSQTIERGRRIVSLHRGGKPKMWSVHRLIALTFLLDYSRSKHIDHIDRDPSNNRLENLRCVSPLENSWNRGKTKSNTSGYKGVVKFKGKYQCCVHSQKQLVFYIRHADPERCAKAYDVHCLNTRGVYCHQTLNFPMSTYSRNEYGVWHFSEESEN